MRLDRGLLPGMIGQRGDVIIRIASIQAKLPLYDSTVPSAAAKAALVNTTRACRRKSTRMLEHIAQSSGGIIKEAETSLTDALGGIPFGRAAWPEQLADFLVSPRAGYLTETE